MEYSREDLIAYIEDLFGQEINNKVLAQIKKFSSQGISYKEMGRCVNYFYEIKRSPFSSYDKYGIGIVPSVLEDANKYFVALGYRYERIKASADKFREQGPQEVRIYNPQKTKFKPKELKVEDIHE